MLFLGMLNWRLLRNRTLSMEQTIKGVVSKFTQKFLLIYLNIKKKRTFKKKATSFINNNYNADALLSRIVVIDYAVVFSFFRWFSCAPCICYRLVYSMTTLCSIRHGFI